MTHFITRRHLAMVCMALMLGTTAVAQPSDNNGKAQVATVAKAPAATPAQTAATDTVSAAADSATSSMLDEAALELSDTTAIDEMAEGGIYTQLKNKFMDGGVLFMSLVALTLILGLACCIERIVYLSMSEIDAKKFMRQLETTLKT